MILLIKLLRVGNLQVNCHNQILKSMFLMERKSFESPRISCGFSHQTMRLDPTIKECLYIFKGHSGCFEGYCNDH
jgi:hypothetical protein